MFESNLPSVPPTLRAEGFLSRGIAMDLPTQ